MEGDTIAAVATPPGRGGIGIVRMSGPAARSIAESLFRPRYPGPWRPYGLRLGEVLDDDGRVVDEVLLAWMPGPRSFTCEDVVEIHGHGGVVAMRRVLELLLSRGARLAEPGEFTRRAYLNGRIDLAQAEAVLEIIRSRTEAGLQAAVEQLGGRLSQEIKALAERVMGVLAEIEASIDFPDEVPPVESQVLETRLAQLSAEADQLLERARQGRLVREGIRLVMSGKPNVGKSSLLNALLDEERALVTEVPGTTRDVLEETVEMAGLLVRLVDTAGIRAAHDVVERLGVERALDVLRGADAVLVLLDGLMGLDEQDWRILEMTQDLPRLVVINKIDVADPRQIGAMRDQLGFCQPLVISALTGAGLEELRQQVARLAWGGEVRVGQEDLVISVRHRSCLERCRYFLSEVQRGLDAGMPVDLLSIDLRGAWEALGEITGETASDAVIERIFSDFCVGK